MIDEINRAIIDNLKFGLSRSDLIIYVSDDFRCELIADCARVIGMKRSKDEPEMLLGCEMRVTDDASRKFYVVERRLISS